ncbi:hypothetical protein BH09BAC5_BH09BAC5_00420 [soil metagenome]
MKKQFLLLLISSLLINLSFAQKSASQAPLRIHIGEWKGELILNDSTQLPFSFSTDLDPSGYTLVIHNASENIKVENLAVTKDSINWNMPVFDSWFKCKIDSLGGFHGMFFNNSASKPYELKFIGEFNKRRYPVAYHTKNKISGGKYECTFSPGLSDSSKAIGIFNYDEKYSKLNGTFLTETGDYRFLEGDYISKSTFEVSCFDGSHAFLFRAKEDKNGNLSGSVWYGKFGYENWIGNRNDNFKLRDPETLTYVKDSSKINFTFNDLNGKPVSLSDPQFKGKVVIIQIMGSWCPNCMDETAWMTEVYNKYHEQGLEIVALSYERSADTSKSNPNIRRVQNHFHSNYTFLNTGLSGSKGASESLPFLNGIMSFPTTIYIDKNGKVRMVFTGFNGPATGAAYEKDTNEALRLIQQLLAEKTN